MPDLTAKRTLVKSPPELWEELSEVDRLAKHLGAFGEITITKLEPEHTVAWEGERASGTVSIEPSGWGTKVTLRAELPDQDEPEPEPVPAEPEPEPVAAEPEPVVPEPQPVTVEFAPVAAEPRPKSLAEPDPKPELVIEEPETIAQQPETEPPDEISGEAPPRGFWGWLFRRRTEPPASATEAVAEPDVPKPEPLAAEPEPESERVVADPEPEPVAAEPEPEPVAAKPEPEPVVTESEPVAAEPEPEPDVTESEPVAAEPEPEPDVAPALDPERARLILDEALDALGAAHHRPFSRA